MKKEVKAKIKAGKKFLRQTSRAFFFEINYLRILLLFAALVAVSIGAYNVIFWGRIYSGIRVAGVHLGGKTTQQAKELLEREILPPQILTLVTSEQTYQLNTKDLSVLYDFSESSKKAFSFARSGNPFLNLKLKWEALTDRVNLGLTFNLDEGLLEEQVEAIASQIDSPAIEPQVSIEKGQVIVEPGKNGFEVEREKLKNLIRQKISFAQEFPFEIPIKGESPRLTQEEIEKLQARAEKFVGKSLEINFEENSFVYKDNQILPLLDPRDGFLKEKVEEFVLSIASGTNRPPQNATFVFEAGRVREFAPAKDGIEVDTGELERRIILSLGDIEAQKARFAKIELPVKKTPPQIRTEDVNKLGIKELIGRGTSRFRGSIPSRVHNIALAASRLNGVLIAPGEAFSFNQALGDVSAFTGYQQAFVIKDGKTILGDGGGVCQVSTTLFRASLNAGLPIVERRQHSYRVGYYEQDSPPGFDATVYAPSVDLKIKNDTPSYILIQARADTRNATLNFELYGTKDGRVAQISKPNVWDVVPPPPDLYQDDPTLPVGTIKQIDFAAWAAKVSFNYRVSRGTDVLQNRTFYSTFRPWQAVYLRGTGPAQ